ncbi:MAG: aminotransferase class III-fold pyridoxal phosphate-dependent enzyme, partial [Anaerolineales bacterium]|nr:aminotransferase class III-fold pyridoxal phosphate-dependent enzyme [Anaerolineales bacterium]
MTQNQVPQIRTPLPGPKARESVSLDDRYVTPSLPRAYPLVVKQGRGVAVEDVDGNVFLDCMAGIAVCATGHCHPRVVSAIQEQAARIIHICGADTYDPMYTRLAQRLSNLAPCEGNNLVFLGNSGSEAVEAAIKLTRNHSGRPLFLAFLGAFHGRTMGSVSLTASKATYRRGYEPLLPGVTHVPYAYCYRCAYNLTYPSCDLACVDYIENQLFPRTLPPDRVAAIFVEPVQGEGGYVVP